MNPLAGWRHDVAEIGERGLAAERKADGAERAEVASALELASCESLETEYEIRAKGHGRYRVTGRLGARLTQACVVTLEPLAMRYSESFDVEFWPRSDLPEASEGESEVLSGDDPEPIENGEIGVGRVIYECLSAVIDPFPRKEGAQFAAPDDARESGARDSPFAVLAKLKSGE